jgi:hypothetical protein
MNWYSIIAYGFIAVEMSACVTMLIILIRGLGHNKRVLRAKVREQLAREFDDTYQGQGRRYSSYRPKSRPRWRV